jgi:hypothetical protein
MKIESNIFNDLSENAIDCWQELSSARYGNDILVERNSNLYWIYLELEKNEILNRINPNEEDEIIEYTLIKHFPRP